MTTVSVSSCDTPAERKTCHGCLLRGDQEVRSKRISHAHSPCSLLFYKRDQADREARFARSCKLMPSFATTDTNFTSQSSCSIRDCYGRFVLFLQIMGKHKFISLLAYEGQSGSKDRGDPEVIGYLLPYTLLTEDAQTSNVFVANLPQHVTEQSLGNFFARMGPVGSVSVYLPPDALPLITNKVKIMWPRGDGAVGPGADMTTARRNRNSGLSGFVSFMRRKDAEAALKEFDGFDWGGSILRVGWSKAVPIAAKPMYG